MAARTMVRYVTLALMATVNFMVVSQNARGDITFEIINAKTRQNVTGAHDNITVNDRVDGQSRLDFTRATVKNVTIGTRNPDNDRIDGQSSVTGTCDRFFVDGRIDGRSRVEVTTKYFEVTKRIDGQSTVIVTLPPGGGTIIVGDRIDGRSKLYYRRSNKNDKVNVEVKVEDSAELKEIE